jgi:hypothetical protein
MKINHFSGRGLHGFLKFDIDFNDDLTLLTGINGSGKTSVLNCIIALITPSLRTLAELDFSSVKVVFENDGKKHFVSADKKGEFVSINTSEKSGSFDFNIFTPTNDIPPSEEERFASNYYADLNSASSQHPAMKFISSLPTPMFLGLDRRSAFGDVSWRQPYASQRLAIRARRNVFAGSLSRSLIDAATLAERKFRDALIASGRLSETLQRELLLELLTVTPTQEYFGMAITMPTAEEINDIKNLRKDVDILPSILNLPSDQVRDRIIPFLDTLDEAIKQIPLDESVETLMDRPPKDTAVAAIFRWNVNIPQLRKIRVVSKRLTDFNKKQAKISELTNRYLKLVNDFLRDSGKNIAADEGGYISVRIDGLSKPRPISSLSSGEAQIFVILTHLSFNPLAQGANVFIIDEPELSLHVHWQELFIDSIRSANPTIQYILATHSPSIILDKVPYCVDISRKSKG